MLDRVESTDANQVPAGGRAFGSLPAFSMRLKRAQLIAVAVLSACAAFAAVGETIPSIEGTTLSQQKIVLPDATRYRVIVLVLGFSHKSAEQTSPWSKRLAADYVSHHEVGYFEAPVLEGVPGLVKPMILRGMRKQLTVAEQGHSLPIDRHADQWKKICGYKEPDDAYVIVASADGRVIWQTHGPVTDSNYAALRSAVDTTRS